MAMQECSTSGFNNFIWFVGVIALILNCISCIGSSITYMSAKKEKFTVDLLGYNINVPSPVIKKLY